MTVEYCLEGISIFYENLFPGNKTKPFPVFCWKYYWSKTPVIGFTKSIHKIKKSFQFIFLVSNTLIFNNKLFSKPLDSSGTLGPLSLRSCIPKHTWPHYTNLNFFFSWMLHLYAITWLAIYYQTNSITILSR